MTNAAPSHSITSSARARIDGGTVRPSAFAVLRLIDQLECRRLLNRQIGGLGALEDLSGVNALLAIDSREAQSIADQPAGRCELTQLIDRRNGMARGQRHELLASADEEGIGADDEPPALQLEQGCEGGVDLAFGGGLQDMEMHPLRASGLLPVSDHGIGGWIVRVHEQGEHANPRNQFGQQLEPFGRQLVGEDAEAREVAARPGETGNQTGRDGVIAAGEDDRDRRGRVFRRERRSVPPAAKITSTLRPARSAANAGSRS